MPAHVAAAARIYASRRMRDLVFGADREGFGEPGWDMLLTIVAAGEAAALDDQMLIAASAAPAEIARPYINWLASRELVVCVSDTQYPQRILVDLTDRGRTMMRAYLDTEIGVVR